MSSSYRLELEKWLATLDVKANLVLDIGGSQEPVKGRTKSWEVDNYIIADLEEPHKGGKPTVIMDINQQVYGGGYDLIFCLEVFEYVYDPMQAFENIEQLLEVGGTAWITFPSIYPLHQPIEDDALRYFPSGIKKLAEAVGLTVEEMIPRRFETNAWQQTIAAERLRAAKGEDHNFSGWIVRFSK